jgi:uncharacterized membrane protein YkvA (DUF1232 family)
MRLPSWIQNWKEKAEGLTVQIFALYLAYRHPGTPWYARIISLAVTAYALSPIDLIPDFIPFVGYLDDLVIVPLGVWLVIRMVPPQVMAECQARSLEMKEAGALQFRWMVPVVISLWVLALAVTIMLAISVLRAINVLSR